MMAYGRMVPSVAHTRRHMMKRWSLVATIAVALAGVALFAASPNDWPQWGQNPQHQGLLNIRGQNLHQTIANIVYAPLVPKEQQLNDGDLLVHYQVPLVEDDNVYMESKTGSYSKGSFATQQWHLNKFTWVGGTLTK